MKEETNINEEIIKKIKSLELKIRILRKKQIKNLQGKFIQTEKNVCYRVKRLLLDNEEVLLNGTSILIDKNHFIYDTTDTDDYVISNLNSLKEITPAQFCEIINQGFKFVKKDYLDYLSQNGLPTLKDSILKRYYQISDNEFYHIQKIINSEDNLVLGLNLTIYPQCIFFSKEEFQVIFDKNISIKEISKEIFLEHVQAGIKFIVDTFPKQYKDLIKI